MIRAIFFDIDGTLVSFRSHKLVNSAKEAILELKKKGIKVFIATGRIKAHINNLDDLEFDGYITTNGFNVHTENKEIYKNVISKEELDAFLYYLENKECFTCSVMTKDGTFINRYDDNVAEVEKAVNLKFTLSNNFAEFVQENMNEVLQINLFVDEEKEKKIMNQIFKNSEATRWHPLFADINTKGGGKHIGVSKILEYYNIDLSETMAFGDGGNDISMIKYVNIGVAMGNANEHLKEVADYITDDVDNDGIVKALKHFNLL